jgi:Cu2+-exporting ATPase
MFDSLASASALPSPPAVHSDRDASRCVHCGNSLGSDAQAGFCCAGCRSVHALLRDAGLLRYYDLRGDAVSAAMTSQFLGRRDRNWVEPVADRLACSPQPLALSFKLQGLHCAACVWLIQQLFEQKPGAHQVIVNSGRGTLELRVDATFPLREFVVELERFGYQMGELSGDVVASDDDLLMRTGVCLALGGNAMMFSAAIYLGLRSGPLFRVLHDLNFACATLAVLLGAPVFMRSAWQAVRRGILHLDLPVAVGIALSYGAALWSFATGNKAAAYYDSLAIFIALMLLGRWFKERIVKANQAQLLDNDGIEKLLARRIANGRVELVPALQIALHDLLLVPSGDLVFVQAEVIDGNAVCSLDWISGESEPVAFAVGEVIPAGAFNAGSSPLTLRAAAPFAASTLTALLGARRAREMPPLRRSHLFSLAYVLLVLAAALGALLYWSLHAGVVRGLEIATAICVVTCPCAIGIATPLAEDMVLAGLRRAGLFVRSASFLERALAVRRIVFDKTGTLTTGRLHVQDVRPLAQLTAAQRDVLYTLVSASVHPKSYALARALESFGAQFRSGVRVDESAGLGLEAVIAGARYRVGNAAWVSAHAENADDLQFGVDGQLLCALRTEETLRADARSEVARLAADGFETSILSGDQPTRVRALASELQIPTERALGGFSPTAKAAFIEQHDRGDMLMIGDGINDCLAVQQAFTSGTPSIDRAFMPWRSDFYFVTPGLSPIRLALMAARRLERVIHRNKVFALAYNAFVVALAMAGFMKPWLAAVLMPVSSIVVLSATSLSLSARSDLWKS